MDANFRRDQICQTYTQEEWNKMYNNVDKEKDELVKLWNQLYTSKSNAAVLFYNKMYLAVAQGKKLSDPDMIAEVRAWNAQANR